MVSLRDLDYQTEEILHAMGNKDLDAVLNFLGDRLRIETEGQAEPRASEGGRVDAQFEAIPYHLHGLKKLLKAHPAAVLSVLRRHLDDESAKVMFPYRSGARLIKAVFPEFEEPLQTLLLKIVKDGNTIDHDFVTAIVRAYGGAAPILEVCKAIVEIVPTESPIWRELAAAIKTTGGAWGEYGMVQAYERKCSEIAAWSTHENERVRAFSSWLTGQLEGLIAHEKQRADEDLALRKYKYGEGKDEA
jgi:hypothetical protein